MDDKRHASSQEFSRIAKLPAKELDLPFKPFTIDEVCAITGATSKMIDVWVNEKALQPYIMPYGLDYIQTFAVYLGVQYLKENSPTWRATEVVRMISRCDNRWLNAECHAGRTFPIPAGIMRRNGIPVPANCHGIMEKPISHVIAERLDTLKLSLQFVEEVKRVFPNSNSLSWG